MTYTSALILGDSITIDLYPANDYALRFARAPLSSRLGAGSILFRNNNAVFPHFAGRDLATEFGIAPEKFLNLSVDGAVPTPHDIDGRIPHSLLLEIYTDAGIGTPLRPGFAVHVAAVERRQTLARSAIGWLRARLSTPALPPPVGGALTPDVLPP